MRLSIDDNIDLVDCGVFLKKHRVLVISDLHIGFEESLVKEGIFVAKGQINKILKKLDSIIKLTKPETTIINGDFKQDFGKINNQEWRDCKKVIQLIKKFCKLVIIKGNHDNLLYPISIKNNVELKKYHTVGDYYIFHGDNLPNDEYFKKSKFLIVGHDHPSFFLRDGPKLEKFKCFVLTNFKRKQVIITPSFNPLIEGSDVEELKDKKNFGIFIGKKKRIIAIGKEDLFDFGTI